MTLAENEVDSYVFLPKGIESSSYSSIMKRGGASIPYDNVKDAMLKLESTLTHRTKRTYIQVYIDILDYFCSSTWSVWTTGIRCDL